MIGDLSNHLWQSTLGVAIAALLTLALRNNGAHVRHRIWMLASLKFLVPFSLLTGLGEIFSGWMPAATNAPAGPGIMTAARDLSGAVDRVAQPFATDSLEMVLPTTAASGTVSTGTLLFAIWAAGFLAVVVMRGRAWGRVRAAVRSSTPLDLPGPYPARSLPGLLEPGVVGIWRPLLLLPAGIDQHLSPAQLRAVLEHEFCHIRRRDNLTSALHMVVEAVCWFHPLVWWVGARLVAERERACDEQVVRACGEPEVYAESILSVCKLYVESPLACVSGVSGADLKARVTAIVAGRVGAQLSVARQCALAVVAMLMLSAPMLAGMFGERQGTGQADARFEVVSVKPCATNDPKPVIGAARPGFRSSASPWAAMVTPGHVYWSCATLAQLIPQAYTDTDLPLLNMSTTLRREDGDQPTYVRGGPSWVTSERFTIEARAPLSLTDPILGKNPSRAVFVNPPPALSQALRAVLEDRFRLKVDRATEQRDMYAMTVAPGGLKTDKITTAKPGDCQTTEQYAAAAASAPQRSVEERLAAGNPRICGRAYSGRSDTGFYTEYTSVTLAQLASMLTSQLDYVVVDRTNTPGPFNFTFGQSSSPGGTRDEHYAGRLAEIGLKLQLVKGPAEYLVIKSVERLRPDSPAGAEAPAGSPITGR
jgi:uncharacterized protein (TIGR03435 family)